MRPRMIMALVGALGVLGCGKSDRAMALPGDDTADPIPVQPPSTLTCDYCVHAGSATFTGPSNFYRGKLDDAPGCRDPTPLQGVEGFLTEPTSLVEFVRECLITPTDTCETEGTVCAPFPEPDFQTCVHHVGDVDCPGEYSAHRETILITGIKPFVMTLCCMNPPISG